MGLVVKLAIYQVGAVDYVMLNQTHHILRIILILLIIINVKVVISEFQNALGAMGYIAKYSKYLLAIYYCQNLIRTLHLTLIIIQILIHETNSFF